MSDTHAETVGSIHFVAKEMLPEQAAPVSTHGPAAWARENLFATWRDTLLTVIFGVIVVAILANLLPWLLFDAVFFADNIRECRELGDGACFAVITSRIDQLIFGFYPSHLYWRPILSFFLMFVAFAPLLHDNLPRKLLWFTALYPVLAYWLLWGGSIWEPVLLVAMIGVAVAAYVAASKVVNTALSIIAAIAAALIWIFFLQGPLASVIGSVIPIALEPVESARFGGFLITFVIGVTGIVGSLPLGILLALGRKSNMPVVKMICVGFIEFIRGVPLITLLFVASTLLNYFLPPGTYFDLILRVLIMVTLFASAYMAEVIRGGLAALPRGQYEAADALGLNYWQSTQLIVLPQALKISIPGIVNTFIGLFKDTTLVSIVGILDPIGIMQPIRSNSDWNGIIWELPIFIGLVFFIACFTMSRYSMYFERKLDTGHRN